MKETVKQLLEVYGRSAAHAGRSISQRIGSKGTGLASKSDDENIEYHREEIANITHAISHNPEWAKEMLPSMHRRLEHHQKRFNELTRGK